MNTMTLLIISLRSAALALLVAGDTKTADRLYAVANAIEAGRATDEHMKLVAEKLKSRKPTDADWDDVMSRIDADSARLQSP